jgi:response regulator RpfG family c-di-GMP phosphodiesterase
MMTGKGEARDASNRLSSNPLMPGMTGVELYACLIEAGHRIPTILVTAYPDEATRARAIGCAYRTHLGEVGKQRARGLRDEPK